MKLYIKRTVDMHSTCVLDAYILPFVYIYLVYTQSMILVF